ncbi:unnamed protein product [Schistosoma margrebowiei]|uniref:Uncharacterized protein n=1 Tax=Schistosoma margrebowiei TaxID=48269 RepID=A0A3P8CCW3_9TREM|nr:unnamed protein product [Schistosoma margrebowiei]
MPHGSIRKIDNYVHRVGEGFEEAFGWHSKFCHTSQYLTVKFFLYPMDNRQHNPLHHRIVRIFL